MERGRKRKGADEGNRPALLARGTEEGMEAGDLLCSQRAASEGPRWTRAVEDQSAPIPEERTSELGGIIKMNYGRLMRAAKDNLVALLRE